MIHRIVNWLVVVILVFIFWTIMYQNYMTFIPVKVIEPRIQPYKVENKVVRQGGILLYQVDVCKLMNAPSIVIRRFVGEVAFTLPAEQNTVQKGCSKTDVPVFVPSYIPPGIWHLDLDIAFQVSNQRTERYQLKTEEFRVIEATASTK